MFTPTCVPGKVLRAQAKVLRDGSKAMPTSSTDETYTTAFEWPLQAMLFVPGDSQRKLDKATTAGADAVIVDLEDSVAPSEKAQARHLARSYMGLSRRCKIGVRINSRETPWHLEDMAAIVSGKPDFLMLPKCASVDDLRIVHHQICVLEASFGIEPGFVKLVPLVTETAASVLGLDYRGAPSRLVAICFAGEDLSSDLGVASRGAGRQFNPLLSIGRQLTALAAAAAGVQAIDTPFPDPRDHAGLKEEAISAAQLGYAGKLCIHPCQVEVVKEAFRPNDEDLAWASSVVAAFRASSATGVAVLDGKMIDKAHLRLAMRRLAEKERLTQ